MSKRELDRLGRSAQQAAGRAGRGRRAWAAFGREMEATQRRATGLSLVMTALATGVVAHVGASFLKAASDAEELRSQFDQVFRELSGEAREWARVHAEAVGRSSLDIEGYLATLQDTFVPLGFAREEAFGLSSALAQLGVDLASFKNAAEPETIDLLTSAIVGNHEAVRRFGIVITESTLKQELMNAGIEGGVQAATEQQKVMARVRIILRSTADAQGDAARTADEYANRVRALVGDWRDFQVLFGAALIPTAQTGVALLRELLTGLSDDVDPDALGHEIEVRFRRVLLGIAAAADALAGPLDIAHRAVGVLVDGFNALPPWVQEIGLLGALLFGRRGQALLAGIAGASALVDALTPSVNARLEELERTADIRRRALKRAEQDVLRATNDPLRAARQRAADQLRERLRAAEVEIERISGLRRLDRDTGGTEAHPSAGRTIQPSTLTAGILGGSLLGGAGAATNFVARIEAFFRRLDEGRGADRATPAPLSLPEIPSATRALTATQEREIGSFVNKMRKALEEIEKEHADAIRALTEAEADLAGPYETAVLAAREWRDETLEGLNETAAGYDEYAARVEAVYLQRIANAAREAADKQLEESKRWRDGAIRGLKQYAESAADVGTQVEDATVKAFRGMEDALVRFVQTGKLEFGDLANAILADLARIAIRSRIAGPLASGLLDLFRGGAGPSLSPDIASFITHSGGLPGAGAGRTRSVDPRLFIGAPRLHGGGLAGLGPNEIPTILERGEGVFTPEQMRALGGLSATPVLLRAEVINESAERLEAREAQAAFDPETWTIRVVVDNIAQGGAIGRQIEGIVRQGGL